MKRSTFIVIAVAVLAVGLATQRVRRGATSRSGTAPSGPGSAAGFVQVDGGAAEVGRDPGLRDRAVATPNPPSPIVRRPAKTMAEDTTLRFEHPRKTLMTTPGYTSRTTQLGERVEALSPAVVEMSLKELGVPKDRIREVQKWDMDFHRDLIALWNPPPKTDADVSQVHRRVSELRQMLDRKCIALLGADLANRYNALYSKNLTRMLNATPGAFAPP